jgi:hypothetical protein
MIDISEKEKNFAKANIFMGYWMMYQELMLDGLSGEEILRKYLPPEGFEEWAALEETI